MNLINVIASAVVIAVFIVGLLQWLSKKTKRLKAKGLYRLINEWFDYIDINLEKGLNMSKLNNIETKVDEYIKDHHLNNYQLYFTPKLRRKFLKNRGTQKELLNNQNLFENYVKFEGNRIHLDMYWNIIRGNFYQFYKNYQERNKPINFANITKFIDLLKMYFNIKE